MMDDLFTKGHAVNSDHCHGARKSGTGHEPKPWLPSKNIRYQDVPPYNPDDQYWSYSTSKKSNLTRKPNFPKAFHPLTWFRNNPKIVLAISYITVFIVGATVGLVPFVKFYIDECKADKNVVVKMNELYQRLNTSMHYAARLSSGFEERMRVKKVWAVGANEMKLICNGKIHIIDIIYDGVHANKESIDKVRKHCDDQEKDMMTHTCLISIQSIFKMAKGNEITEILYKCPYSQD